MKRQLYDSGFYIIVKNICLHVLFIINYFGSVDFYLILIRYLRFIDHARV